MTQPPYGSAPYGGPPGAQIPQQQAAPGMVPAPPLAPNYAPQQPGPYGPPTPAQYAQPAPQGYPPNDYPPQAYAPPPYGQPPYGAGQNPYAAQWGQQQQPMGTVCRFCGGFPAVEATVRGHQGMLVVMRFLSLKGPFCRDCGIAVHRQMSTRTMWQGWWGYLSFLITPFTLLYNLSPRSKFNKLPPAQGGFRPPSDPGKPIFLRPGALGLLAPLFVLFVVMIAVLASN
ncbi:hypothetical protein [Streptantibioticus silvisoli]|jgi:hypothetical protein|uniref:Toxin-antitoxin system, toxin component n=1 Tax=Streptantibioticus silvisoli TaxID=2705255 RepID=A0ABT6VUS0_9ACTN|nr:hypothetical protein [Streptantibioticus silvisoli]MDI5961915.1 hypothetical protein [Streptantibioticus silvisoli]